jgi:chromatin segregation and condensation protein Rec8/ScpA/Scc1 (kleisin family)
MSISQLEEEISPNQPSHPPKSTDKRDINLVIDEIDELMKKQISSENKRQEALATTTAAHREIDLAQDLLHTSLQRIANVDDDTFHARAVLSTKEETLNKVKTRKTQVKKIKT